MTTTATTGAPTKGFLNNLIRFAEKAREIIEEVDKAYLEPKRKAEERFFTAMANIAATGTKKTSVATISDWIRRGDLGVIFGVEKGDVLAFLASLVPEGDLKLGEKRIIGVSKLDERDFWTLVREHARNPIVDAINKFNDAMGF